MKDNEGNAFLDILVGEKLSSVTFVMDYLQVDFDGNHFTLNVWPEISINNRVFRYGDSEYRDKLCSLISIVVLHVIASENERLSIEFENGGRMSISLDPNNPELETPEIAIFTDVNEKWYIL